MQYGDIVFVLAECKFILTYLHITVKVILCNPVTWPAIYTCSLFFKTLFEKQNKTKKPHSCLVATSCCVQAFQSDAAAIQTQINSTLC